MLVCERHNVLILTPRYSHPVDNKQLLSQRTKAIIHQLTTMLSTSKNVLYPGHNHLLTTSADDHTL